MARADAIAGAVLGCAVGDALGLPFENLSRRRGPRLFGGPLRYRFLFGRGMVSDDTEHTCMAAQALCDAPTDADLFARRFARRLRWWLLGIPAGIGLATLKAALKLWLGVPASRSGVLSAGNGPAMRSPVLGAALDDPATLRGFVRASTRVTHTDPKAEEGAFAVALATWFAKRGTDTPAAFFATLRATAEPSKAFAELLAKVERSVAGGEATDAFAAGIGCAKGVSGYVFRTVPVVLHAWLSFPRDYRQAVEAVIRCGGDTDTTAAIVGAVVGSGVGPDGIPAEWVAGLWEWPRSMAWMRRLAGEVERAVGSGTPVRPPGVAPGIGLIRNAVFAGAVFAHIGRRMLPPY